MRIDKFAVLKFIDHWIGGPICICLVLIHRLTHPFLENYDRLPADQLPPKNILLMKFMGLGSIVLSTSIIKDVKAAYPNTKIYYLTFKNNKEIIDILSVADGVLTIDAGNPLALAASVIQALVFCRSQRIDVAMDIEFYSKFSTMMAFLSGARWRMGFYLGRFWRNSLFNVPVNFNYSLHILEIYASFSKALGITGPIASPQKIHIADEEKEAVVQGLKKYNISDLSQIIVLNIHASDLALARRWPAKHFAQLAGMALDEYKQMRIILTGVKDEAPYSRRFMELVREHGERITDLTGKLTLKQFLALLSQVPLFVTNDSGPFHLANAVGARTISLWGPSSFEVHGFFGMEKEGQDYIYKKLSCSPCVYIYRTDAGYFCQGKAPCMEQITPKEVMILVRKNIGRAGALK